MKQFPIDSKRLKSALSLANRGIFKFNDLPAGKRESMIVEFCAVDNHHQIWCNVESTNIDTKTDRSGVLKLINKTRGRFVRILGKASMLPGSCSCTNVGDGNFIVSREPESSGKRVLKIEIMHMVNYVKRTGNIEVYA
jgi:hypothetical protein